MLKLFICLIFASQLHASTDLYIKSLKDDSMNVFCGAVAIDSGVYVTAAHCVNNFHKDEMKLGSEKKNIDLIIKHNYYKNGYKFDQLDFAIITTNSTNNNIKFGKVAIGDIVYFKNSRFKIVELFDTEFKAIPLDAGVCLNDSGSAAYKDNKVVGILSRGDIGCKKYAIFSKIQPIVEWYKESGTIKVLAKKSKLVNLKYFLTKIKGY